MRTDAVQVALRPRGALEAVDLGLAMAREWWRPIATSWLAIVVPPALLLVFALRDHPWWAVLLLWWLRPAFGRVPLYVLSRKLFGEGAGLRDAVLALPTLARSGILVSLTTQRFTPTRTFLLAVLQLEGLRGRARRERGALLARQDVGAAMGLLAVGAHMNGALLMGVPLAIGILVPEEVSWRVGQLAGPLLGDASAVPAGVLMPLLYLLGISFVEPLLVAGGFALYLNRRIFLEGWDIDLAFRRLAGRRRRAPARAAAALLAGILVLGGSMPYNASAENGACDPQDLASGGGCIERILASEDFGVTESRTVWVPRDFDTPDLSLPGASWIGEALATLFQLAAWGVLVGLLVALAIAVAKRVEPPRLRTDPKPGRPVRLFGLDLDPAALPADPLAAARDAWAEGRSIDAMSLLYRGALIWLVDQGGLSIPESATEYECVARVERIDQPGHAEQFRLLTDSWISSRYAGLPPTDATFERLCQGFDRAFRVSE